MRRSSLQIIGLSLFLLLLVGAGCKKKTPPPAPPPPPPPAAAAPTATLAANPTSIERGQASTIEWSTKDATEITIEPDLGTVQASGSRSVRPTQSTTYRLTAKGAGGSVSATARVTVTAPPPGPTEPARPGPVDETLETAWQRRIQIILFDYDQFDIRDDQRAAMQGNGEFLLKFANVRVVIEGHCDERGSAQYNLGLGQKRADAIKDFLIAMGVGASRIRTISYGKEKPACMDANEACWQQNRRGVFVRE